MAMDAIIADLQEKRAVKIGVAYLCTPTDAHVIPAAANAASVNNLKRCTFVGCHCTTIYASSVNRS